MFHCLEEKRILKSARPYPPSDSEHNVSGSYTSKHRVRIPQAVKRIRNRQTRSKVRHSSQKENTYEFDDQVVKVQRQLRNLDLFNQSSRNSSRVEHQKATSFSNSRNSLDFQGECPTCKCTCKQKQEPKVEKLLDLSNESISSCEKCGLYYIGEHCCPQELTQGLALHFTVKKPHPRLLRKRPDSSKVVSPFKSAQEFSICGQTLSCNQNFTVVLPYKHIESSNLAKPSLEICTDIQDGPQVPVTPNFQNCESFEPKEISFIEEADTLPTEVSFSEKVHEPLFSKTLEEINYKFRELSYPLKISLESKTTSKSTYSEILLSYLRVFSELIECMAPEMPFWASTVEKGIKGIASAFQHSLTNHFK